MVADFLPRYGWEPVVKASRIAALAVAAAVLVALFVVLRPRGDAGTPAAPTVDVEASPAVPTVDVGASPAVPIVDVEVRDGVVRGPGRVEVEVGDTVVLAVTADVEDEVHVHGYDVTADVAPGSPARVSFEASTAGIFEVELEGAQIELLRLVVAP